MRPIKLKTKIMILLISLTCFISIVFYAFSNYLFYDLQTDYNSNIKKSLEGVKSLNNYLADNDFESFGKNYLRLVVNSIFNAIIYHQYVIPNSNGSGGVKVNQILASKDIKEIIANSVSINNTKVADFAIIQNKKIILCSLIGANGKPVNSFKAWLNKYDILKKYFSKKNPGNDYELFTKNKNHFLIVRHFPGTHCYIIGSIAPSKIKQNTSIAMQTINTLSMLESNMKKDLNDTWQRISTYRIVIFILILLICIPLSILNASTITKPIIKLRNEVRKFTKGKFKECKIEEKGNVEIVDLIKSFNTLGRDLESYMSNLEREISQREKLESEIKIAAEVQASSLPIITADIIRPEFSITAKLNPAAIAAGDFYDFFYVSEDTLALVIADVSGKGISAAFFMSLAKATLSGICRHENSPAEALNKTNNILSENNNKSMFVTTFLIYYNIKTGKLTYSNAGHHNAIICHNRQKITVFGEACQPPLGVIPGFRFAEDSHHLKKEDVLFLYTDGITEAVSKKNIEFGENNLHDLIKANINLKIDKLTEKIVSSVRSYEEGELFDDITLLVFKRNE